MKKYITAWIASLLAAVSVAGAAFATWRFNSTPKSDHLDIKVDDIAENYSFSGVSNKQLTREYDIYFFPSTLYLQDYKDYLDGVTTVKPEELYGYIEPILDESGDPILNANDKADYKVTAMNNGSKADEIEDDNKHFGDDAYLDVVAENKDYLLSSASPDYYDLYSSSADWKNKNYDYGDPEDDVQYNIMSSVNNTNKRNVHRYDRFGYWPTLAKDEGRYLPLKIHVEANLSGDFYNAVSLYPATDMRDKQNWYVYSFSLWSYVSVNDDGSYKLPYYADGFLSGSPSEYSNISLSAFCPTEVAQYFNFMETLENYADPDGVIRLFPKFSNGKGYDMKSIQDGGGDGIRMTPTYKAATTVLDQVEFFMSYTSEGNNDSSTKTYGSGTSSVTVAPYTKMTILPNVNIDLYTELKFEIALTTSAASWGDDWSTAHTIENGNANTAGTLEYIRDKYGHGTYNIYLFLGCVASSGNSRYSYGNLLQYIIAGTDIFPSLTGKFLTQIYAGSLSNKPVLIVFEKVRDIRVVTDIAEASPSEETIQKAYTNADQNFQLMGLPVYEIDAGTDTVPSDSVSLLKTYPYCYILRNIDFIDAKTNRFQIRFQTRYRSDLTFSAGDSSKDLINNPTKDSVGNFSFEADQRYIEAFGEKGYFNLVTGKTAEGDEEQFFELKSDDYRGVYDFILVYRPEDQHFHVYVHRQTNVFVKILANDPTGEDSKGFVVHQISTSDTSPNMLIFQAQYFLGASMQVGDLNEEEGIVTRAGWSGWEDYTLSEAKDSLETCVNAYVAKLLEVKGGSYEDVVLRDHVTGAIAAYYEQDAEGKWVLKLNSFKIRKNYILYVTFRADGAA